MRKSDYLFFLLLACAAGTILYIIIRGYYQPLSSSEVTLKDITPDVIAQRQLPEPDTAKPEQTVTTRIRDTQFKFYIIIGSFKNQNDAESIACKIKKDKNADIIVLPQTEDGNYRVSYGSYSTIAEARSVITSVRANIKPDAWILALKR